MGPRSPRGAISRHAVLDAALAIIDQYGLDSLSIRRLARELGTSPMALYTHFASKRELLDLVFDRVVERLFMTMHHVDWQTQFEEGCQHMRRVLLEHPHWVALLARVNVPTSGLSVYNRLLGLMSKDGIRPEAAMFAFSSVMSHALGSVLVERMLGGKPPIPRQRLELVRGILETMPPGSYPRIAVAARKFDRWSFDDVFDLGLHSLVAGLDRSMPRRGPRRHPEAPRRKAR